MKRREMELLLPDVNVGHCEGGCFYRFVVSVDALSLRERHGAR